MDFDFSGEQYGLRDEARRFLAEQCPPEHVREFIEDPAGWSRTLWKQMAGVGWMALPFPQEYGGLGQSFLDLVLLIGEVGCVLAPVPFLSSVAFAGQIILRHGSEAQRTRWLPGIASGERIGALAVTAGQDRAVVTERMGDGSTRLVGEHSVVIDAPVADLLVVSANAETGPAWFVVEEGARVTTKRGFDRTRPIGSVSFDGVHAEPLARGGLDPGLRLGVVALCAEMVGVAQKILDMSVQYSKDRVQFGRPIGSFQAIKHKAAEMATDLEAARAAAFYACWAAATDAPDADVASSIAKSFCAEVLSRLAGEGVQMHGGIAFTWEHDMHLYLKRIKADQILLGDESYHRERIARLVDL